MLTVVQWKADLVEALGGPLHVRQRQCGQTRLGITSKSEVRTCVLDLIL